MFWGGVFVGAFGTIVAEAIAIGISLAIDAWRVRRRVTRISEGTRRTLLARQKERFEDHWP